MGDLSMLEDFPSNYATILVDYTYRELEDIDFVQVSLEDKRGGMIKKHTNYSVYSRQANKTVVRRCVQADPTLLHGSSCLGFSPSCGVFRPLSTQLTNLSPNVGTASSRLQLLRCLSIASPAATWSHFHSLGGLQLWS
jgi:hypothetical protein